MRVSVIINTVDRAASLRTALESLRRQNYPDFEVIVINCPSTDATSEVLAEYRSFIRAGSIDARNLAISRNVGVEMARGDLIAFTDDDAVADEDWLADAVAGFDSDDVAGVCGFIYDHTGYNFQYRFSLVDRLSRGIHNIFTPIGEQFCYPGVTVFPSLIGCNAIFRRSAVLEVGGFDEEYEYYLEETDLCLRLIEAGYVLKQLPNAFIYHRNLASYIRQTNRVVTNVFPSIKVQCGEAGWKREEVIDALNVALIVGGSIVIPHLRRAFARMREIPGLEPGTHSSFPRAPRIRLFDKYHADAVLFFSRPRSKCTTVPRSDSTLDF